MKNIYLYPLTKRKKSSIDNPYMTFLAESLSREYRVLNLNKPSNSGIIDIFRYLNKIDIVYFNWVEDLPDKYMGILQSIIFFLLFPYFKCKGIKVVWTLHNKQSHFGNNPAIKNMIFRLLLKRSDLIITHAREGLNIISEERPKIYIPHPVKVLEHSELSSEKKDFDIIIWGSIARYKGIDAYLQFLEKKGMIEKYRIMIAGKVNDSDLLHYLEKVTAEHDNVSMINKFIDFEELNKLISRSKIVLFSYHSESVLSSGALMDSLNFPAVIIGPDTGAFLDLSTEGIVYTFTDYEELLEKTERILNGQDDRIKRYKKIKKFIEDNTWHSFSGKITRAFRDHNL